MLLKSEIMVEDISYNNVINNCLDTVKQYEAKYMFKKEETYRHLVVFEHTFDSLFKDFNKEDLLPLIKGYGNYVASLPDMTFNLSFFLSRADEYIIFLDSIQERLKKICEFIKDNIDEIKHYICFDDIISFDVGKDGDVSIEWDSQEFYKVYKFTDRSPYIIRLYKDKSKKDYSFYTQKCYGNPAVDWNKVKNLNKFFAK